MSRVGPAAPPASAIPGTWLNQELVTAVPSACHKLSGGRDHQSALSSCIHEATPLDGSSVCEYLEKYKCHRCPSLVKVLVGDYQSAPTYRVFCVSCYSMDLGFDFTTLDIYLSKPCEWPVPTRFLMKHQG